MFVSWVLALGGQPSGDSGGVWAVFEFSKSKISHTNFSLWHQKGKRLRLHQICHHLSLMGKCTTEAFISDVKCGTRISLWHWFLYVRPNLIIQSYHSISTNGIFVSQALT